MEFEHLIRLIQTVSDSELTEFRYEENGVKIRMGKKQELQPVENWTVEAGCRGAAVTPVLQEKAPEEKAQKEVGKIVSSPLVGVFYEAPAEDAAPFVAVGDTVKKGQVLAIVEAMKLMNEIVAEQDGTVVDVCAHNGDVVEYGQTLFKLS